MPKELDGSLFGDQHCFGCGPRHPAGFRMRFHEEGDEVVTRLTPGDGHQGAPGIMHGGLILTVADELAAWVCILKLTKFGFTARYEGRLQAPARVGLELHGRARIARKTTRTAEVAVSLAQGESTVLDGSFTFVLLDKAGAEKLLGRALPPEWARFAR